MHVKELDDIEEQAHYILFGELSEADKKTLDAEQEKEMKLKDVVQLEFGPGADMDSERIDAESVVVLVIKAIPSSCFRIYGHLHAEFIDIELINNHTSHVIEKLILSMSTLQAP